MMKRLALVTGGSRGIGFAIARGLAADGANLILVARDVTKLNMAAQEIASSYNVEVTAVAVDLDDFGATEIALTKALNGVEKLDILVNAAGIFRFGTSSAPLSDLSAMMSTNVYAAHIVCGICLPALQRADGSRIFSIASVAGVEPFSAVGAYGASKYALVGYMGALGRELLPLGVKVTTICPDVVDTDMAAGSGMAPGEMLAPEDVSNAVKFVLSLSSAAVVERLTIGCKPVSHGPRGNS